MSGRMRSRRVTIAGLAVALACAAVLASALPALAAPAGGVDLANLVLGTEQVATGFASPLYVTGARDGSGRLFVVEQGGLIKVVRNGVVQPTPYLDLSALTRASGEQGLLGLAFSPGYRVNGRLYVDYTDLAGNTVVARYTVADPAADVAAITSTQVILRVTQPYPNHNGGCLQFGPDNYLYIGMGDGGSAGDPGNRAQNRRSLLGKLLRIDTGDRKASTTWTGRYKIPPSNPYAKRRGVKREIWSYGLRNPWRFSFDSATRDLWIGDVGQDAREEVDFAKAGSKGQNWGWHVWEGSIRYTTRPRRVSRKGYSFPIAQYSHPQGESITGGYVYRGSQYPALQGTYLYADFIKGWIGGVRRTTPSGRLLRRPQRAALLQTSGMISSFGTDDARELYFTDYAGGTLYRVTATTR